MGFIGVFAIIGGYVLLSFILLPVQYKYIKKLKEDKKIQKDLGITTGEYYDKMSFETQELHFNVQGNLLFIGANLLATLFYKFKHK